MFWLRNKQNNFLLRTFIWGPQVRIQRGGTGGPDPPGKSQVIWVSVGNKHLDAPGKSWTPSGTLKNDGFLLN